MESPEILDPLRDNLLRALDQGAVCIEIDPKKAGQTAEARPDAPLMDIPGIEVGRNWAHVNSIEYDPKDDSIILSIRHQGVIKIGRDKQVKWILGTPGGVVREVQGQSPETGGQPRQGAYLR